MKDNSGQPHYIPVVEELIRLHGHKVKPGMKTEIVVYHDDDCPALSGGICDCEPRADLILLDS